MQKQTKTESIQWVCGCKIWPVRLKECFPLKKTKKKSLSPSLTQFGLDLIKWQISLCWLLYTKCSVKTEQIQEHPSPGTSERYNSPCPIGDLTPAGLGPSVWVDSNNQHRQEGWTPEKIPIGWDQRLNSSLLLNKIGLADMKNILEYYSTRVV